MLTITQEEGQTASEEGRSKLAYISVVISHPKLYSTILAPLPFGSLIHAPTKMKFQKTRTACPCCLCLFCISSSRQMFSRSIPQHQTAKEATVVFFKALAFITCNRAEKAAHDKIQSWSEYMGQAAFLHLTHTAGTSFWKEEIWEAGSGLQNHVTWEKADKEKVCAHMSETISLQIPVYIYSYQLNRLSFRLQGKITTKGCYQHFHQ